MNKSTKLYIIISFLLIIGLVFALIQLNKSNPDSKMYKQNIKDFKSKVEFFETLLEADNLIYNKNNPEQAFELLKSIKSNEANPDIINSKIKGYQKFLNAISSTSPILNLEANEAAKDIAVMQKKIDSLNILNKKSRDSLSNQITDLKEQLIKSKNVSSGKDNIQVISFKGVRGNKIHYIGEVRDNKANGNGIGIWVTGSIYKGEWKNNIRHGQGIHEWPDGEKYDGKYSEGKRRGFGKYYWPNGERYEGEWIDDKRNGKGILFDPDGNIRFEGNWSDDKPLKK